MIWVIGDDVQIITSIVKNHDNDLNNMLSLLDLKDYLINELGQTEFNCKFLKLYSKYFFKSPNLGGFIFIFVFQ